MFELVVLGLGLYFGCRYFLGDSEPSQASLPSPENAHQGTLPSVPGTGESVASGSAEEDALLASAVNSAQSFYADRKNTNYGPDVCYAKLFPLYLAMLTVDDGGASLGNDLAYTEDMFTEDAKDRMFGICELAHEAAVERALLGF